MGQGTKKGLSGFSRAGLSCLFWVCGVATQLNADNRDFSPPGPLAIVPEEPFRFRVERVAGAISSESEVYSSPAVERASLGRLSLFRSDTIDGVIFTLSTKNTRFSPGETLYVNYRIRNRSMGTVLYDFNSGCQFDMQVAGSRSTRLYSFLEKQICSSRPSRLSLRPSTETVMKFPGFPLTLKHADTLKIKAQMAGYPLSSVQMSVPYSAAAGVSEPVYLEGGKMGTPMVDFNKETKMLVIRLDRAQRLTVSAFVLTGKKVNKLSCEKFLAPGTHLISFHNRKLANGVVIFKVEGNGFSESKTINLTR
jgi:hypothetical protein